MHVLITGIPGSGKTSVFKELEKRNIPCIDIDSSGFCFWRNKCTLAKVNEVNWQDLDWLKEHGWYCDINEFKQYAENTFNDGVYICGVVENLEELASICDKRILLSVNDDVISKRLDTRIDNDFGKSDLEKEFIFQDVKEHLLKTNDLIHINSNEDISKIVDEILTLI